MENKVFISYAWGGDSEKIAINLEQVLQGRHIQFVRDKRDLSYKGLVTDFMKTIGMGDAVIVIISDKYLKSPYCMFELMEIYRNRNFKDRIFPIILEDAKIFDITGKIIYFKYWEDKKLELGEKILKAGADAIAVVGHDYNIYHRILGNLGEVIDVLKDIYSLSPEIHREENFQQLQDAILNHFQENFQSREKKDNQNLLKKLRQGSRQYYQELTGVNGPYNHLDISNKILSSIKSSTETKNEIELLKTFVKNESGESCSLEVCAEKLWQDEKAPLILLGDGGMGKTVSLIHLWKKLINLDFTNHPVPIPIFITLNEYNFLSDDGRTDFITKRIAWHYLGVKENYNESINLLWQVFKATAENNAPNILLLLDGFNEIISESSETTSLHLELRELRQKGNSIQIILSSRYEMNFSWANGFKVIELLPLDEKTIVSYLQEWKLQYPKDLKLQQTIQNPMMLTLYAHANEIIKYYQYDKKFKFKPIITTPGELIWNYFEAQIINLNQIYNSQKNTFFYYKFIIRHFLPYLGFKMESLNQFTFIELQFQELIREACMYFYRKEFLQAFPEFRPYLRHFNLAELDFAENAERFEMMASILCNTMGLMKKNKNMYEFLHQNFRDYFAAAHILNELFRDSILNCIPEVIKNRPLNINVRLLLGQIAGESNKTGNNGEHPTIFMKTLNSLRGIFEADKIGYSIWNIVNIWKDTRTNLGGIDFSSLNLLHTGFQFKYCYDWSGDSYNSSNFSNSLVNDDCFVPKGHISFVKCVNFHPSGSFFVSGSTDRTIKSWDLLSGECLTTFKGHTHAVNSVAISPDGSTVVSGSSDCTIKVWDFFTGKCLNTFRGHKDWVEKVYFSENGKVVYSVSYDEVGLVLDLKSGECVETFEGNVVSIALDRSEVYHQNGRTIIVIAGNNEIISCDRNTGEDIITYRGHSDSVNYITVSPDGKTFISGSDDCSIKLWDFKTGACLATFDGAPRPFTSVAFYPNGNLLISGSWNEIKIWDLDLNICIGSFVGHAAAVNSIAFHPTENSFISASIDGTVKLWDIKKRKCLATFDNDRWIECVAFHPDGKTFISGSYDGTVKAWGLSNTMSMSIFERCSSPIKNIAFHPKGHVFATGSDDGTIKLWDFSSGKCLHCYRGHNRAVCSISFHPNEEFFISGSEDSSIKAWDILTGQCIATLKKHERDVEGVSFNVDGKKFVSFSRDKTIRIWDWSKKKCIKTSKKTHGFFDSLSVNPKGRTFATGTWNFTLNVWDFDTGKSLVVLQNMPGIYLAGCRFMNLHHKSNLSEDVKNLMRQHGAIFDEEDKIHWEKAINK